MNHSIQIKLALGAVAVFLVLVAFGVLSISNLPLLGIFLICPLMMMFMMGGMNSGGRQDDESTESDKAKHSTHKH